MSKTARIGMRISPEKKDLWAQKADEWGYSGTSALLEAMVDWAIAYEKYDGDYEAYLKGEGKL